jgi:orotate phosphoribosyltransferase
MGDAQMAAVVGWSLAIEVVHVKVSGRVTANKVHGPRAVGLSRKSFRFRARKSSHGAYQNFASTTFTTLEAKMALPEYKSNFLKDCVSSGALKFGTFTLKSKRISPYFFNAGLFHRADLLRSISSAYAHTLKEHGESDPSFQWDVLFGPAYKGIPLAAATVDKLAQLDDAKFGKKSYSFNRKEAKDHGEGGNIVGASLKGQKIVIVDDVMTAGTAIREAIDIIKKEGGELVGIIIAFDRKEKTPSATDDDGTPRPSTIGEVRREYGIPVLSILTLDDVIVYLKDLGSADDLKRLDEYRAKYKASD